MLILDKHRSATVQFTDDLCLMLAVSCLKTFIDKGSTTQSIAMTNDNLKYGNNTVHANHISHRGHQERDVYSMTACIQIDKHSCA